MYNMDESPTTENFEDRDEVVRDVKTIEGRHWVITVKYREDYRNMSQYDGVKDVVRCTPVCLDSSPGYNIDVSDVPIENHENILEAAKTIVTNSIRQIKRKEGSYPGSMSLEELLEETE